MAEKNSKKDLSFSITPRLISRNPSHLKTMKKASRYSPTPSHPRPTKPPIFSPPRGSYQQNVLALATLASRDRCAIRRQGRGGRHGAEAQGIVGTGCWGPTVPPSASGRAPHRVTIFPFSPARPFSDLQLSSSSIPVLIRSFRPIQPTPNTTPHHAPNQPKKQ